MSAKLYQSIILQVKNEISREISILDENCVVVASSDLRKIGNMDYQAVDFTQNQMVTNPVSTYKASFDDTKSLKNIICVGGTDEKSMEIASVLSASVASISALYDDKYDKTTFVKNIILDNILPGDIYVKSSELNFNVTNSKIVYLIRQVEGLDSKLADAISEALQGNEKHFVIHINERDVALVYDIENDISIENIYKIAEELRNDVTKKISSKIIIGHGCVYDSLEEISKSYKEAQIAIEVGEVFDAEKAIIGFDNLGVGRLIYQLPTTLCKMFLGEVFKKGSIDSLDEETLSTIKAFFENNLNVSETSRKLFVHRNTLVYRLDKIRKITGLDLREFDHAIVFKVALMVRKYLDARDQEKILF